MNQELNLGLGFIGGICGGFNTTFIQSVLTSLDKKRLNREIGSVAKIKLGGRVDLDDTLGCGCCMGRIVVGLAGVGLGVAYPWPNIATSIGLVSLWIMSKFQTRFGDQEK